MTGDKRSRWFLFLVAIFLVLGISAVATERNAGGIVVAAISLSAIVYLAVLWGRR